MFADSSLRTGPKVHHGGRVYRLSGLVTTIAVIHHNSHCACAKPWESAIVANIHIKLRLERMSLPSHQAIVDAGMAHNFMSVGIPIVARNWDTTCFCKKDTSRLEREEFPFSGKNLVILCKL